MTRRPHVLTLVDHLAGGGAERFAVDLACRLPAAEFERTICVSRMPQDWLTLPPDAGGGLEITRLREAGVAFLLLVSLVLSTALAAMGHGSCKYRGFRLRTLVGLRRPIAILCLFIYTRRGP